LQANPVCQQKGYKSNILAALPKLTNLDGERNPKDGITTSSADQCMPVVTNCAARSPDFNFTLPAPWFSGEQLQVADMPCQPVGVELLQRLAQVHAKLEQLKQDSLVFAQTWAH
jgi:hypothetical protein